MADDAEARALASGLRLRILRMCLDEPLTNREIAEALGKNPATVLHHVRTLADTGFLEAQEVRRGRRGAREIPYLATGKSWWVQTPAAAGRLLEAFLSEIASVPPEQRVSPRNGGTVAYNITQAETANTFTVTAAPQGGQTKDTRCGTLTLNQAGQKTKSGTGELSDCW